MKKSITIFILTGLFLIGCDSNKSREKDLPNNVDTTTKEKTALDPKNKEQNELFVLLDQLDTLKVYTREEYNKILDNDLTEIPENSTENPDSLYASKTTKSSAYKGERGIDLYYLVYAQYVKENVNKQVSRKVRNDLMELFDLLNTFMHRNHKTGDEMAYHINQRIPAYVEYNLINLDEKELKKKVDEKEKEAFMKDMKNQIFDEEDLVLISLTTDLDDKLDSHFKLKHVESFLEDIYDYLL